MPYRLCPVLSLGFVHLFVFAFAFVFGILDRLGQGMIF